MITEFLITSFYAAYIIGWPTRMAHLLCILLLVLNELSDLRFTKKTLVGAIVCIALYGIVAYRDAPMSNPALLFIFVFCGRNISFEKIAKVSLSVSCFLLVFIVISSYLGIITNYVENYDNRRREYLGFLYSLYPAAHISNITSLTVYLKRKSIDWKTVLILLVANIWIFVKTNSRLSFSLSILTICLAIGFQYVPKLLENNKILHMGLKLSFALSSSISFILTLLYNEKNFLLQKLNSILGNRLYFGKHSLFLYGVSFFGKSNVEWIGNGLDENGMTPVGEALYVDNLYIQVMQKFGIVFVVILLVLLTVAMFELVEQKQYILSFILAMIAIHCVIDDLFMAIYYNPFWFVIGSTLMNENNHLQWIPPIKQLRGRKKNKREKKLELLL